MHTSPYTSWSRWWISALGISSLTRKSMTARWQNEILLSAILYYLFMVTWCKLLTPYLTQRHDNNWRDLPNDIQSFDVFKYVTLLMTFSMILVNDISQWGIQACRNFVLEKQIPKLMYYYLFQTWNYCIVYFDGLEINSCWKCLFADDSTERKFIQLPRLHTMILYGRGSNINFREKKSFRALNGFIWPRAGFSSCFPSTW